MLAGKTQRSGTNVLDDAVSCDLPKMTQEPQPKLYCCQDLKDWLIGQPVRAMKNSEQSAKLPIPIVYALAFEVKYD